MFRPGIFRHPPEPQKQPPFDIAALPVKRTLYPAGIASSFRAGAHTVKGGAWRLVPTGIASSFKTGFPTLVGGGGGVLCYIGGVLFPVLVYGASDPLPGGAGGASAVTFQSQTLGRWTLKLDVFDTSGAYVPAVGQTINFLENGARMFSGCITEVSAERLTATNQIVYHVTAADKSAIFDHRVINVAYTSGTDVAAVVRDIITNQIPGEGVTINTLAASIIALDQAASFFFVTVRQALDRLATDCACVWWVDIYGELHFTPTTALTVCPFSITLTNAFWRSLSVKTTLVDYRNKQFAVSNLQPLPTQTGGGGAAATVTETYTIPEAASVARGMLAGTIITNFPIAQITSFKVNGVAQTVYLGSSGYNFRHAWWFFPLGNVVVPPNAQNDIPALPSAPSPSSDPVNGDVVEIIYVPSLPNNAPANLAAPTAGIAVGTPLTAAGGTCGSGIFEAVEQVKNVNVIADLNAIAAAVLTRSGGTPPKYIQFEIDVPGAQVGQQLQVNIADMGVTLADTFIITSIAGTHQGGDLGHGTGFRFSIIAQTGQDKGNHVKWFERLIARTENALPILQSDAAAFVLSPGSSITGAVNVTNPDPVKRSGKLAEVTGIAGTAPTGQDLLIDILADGVSIFPAGGKLRIPAGSTTLQRTTTFANGAASYLFKDQIITCTTSYSVLSGTVTAASSVTVHVIISV